MRKRKQKNTGKADPAIQRGNLLLPAIPNCQK